MKFIRKISHGINHPNRAINYLFGGRKGKQKAIYSFITDYDKDVIPLKKLSSFLDIEITSYYNELLLNEEYKKIENDMAENSVGEFRRNLWLFGFTEARLLYVICRALKPKIIIETGVASGLSSFMFLLAMKKNNLGHLYSIDLPLGDKRSYPPRKSIGWLVPESLRDGWILTLEDSKTCLPRILSNCEYCDLFLHDSLHTYEHMMWEYETVWPRTKMALLSDDIYLNNAFDNFTKTHKTKSQKLSERMGIVTVDK